MKRKNREGADDNEPSSLFVKKAPPTKQFTPYFLFVGFLNKRQSALGVPRC